jgi:hypothetical protein
VVKFTAKVQITFTNQEKERRKKDEKDVRLIVILNGLPPSCIGYTYTAGTPDLAIPAVEKHGKASFWVFILPYMEQTAFYDFISEKTDSFYLGCNATNLWNFAGATDAERQSYQERIGSVSLFLCPSRRGDAGSFLGKTDAGDSTKVYGTQGDYAIIVGRESPKPKRP